MISRRNIRIKVFQTIYEISQQFEQHEPGVPRKMLDDKLRETQGMLAATMHLSCLICEYVLIFANQRASKYIPTEADLAINTKLAGNTTLHQLKQNVSFSDVIKSHKVASMFDNEFIRQLFLILLQSEEYTKYIQSEERLPADEKSIFLFIVRNIVMQQEVSSAFLSEQFLGWQIDEEMIDAWLEKILASARTFQFNKLISADKLAFGHDLLAAYYDKKEIVFGLIEPKLVNWDADRVAMIDLILLHLGICEMLYFPTIPVKVTINEYIDLAKSYSTLQSGQFVNGLLDNVHKELAQDQKLHKETYHKK
jgi:N utilization substance protein B